MSDLNITPENVICALQDAEQISLALAILIKHSASGDAVSLIADQLNEDLQGILSQCRFLKHDEEGVWGLPMLSALESQPC